MKILHAVFSDGFYGSERYCIELALAQSGAGHDVAIVIQDGATDCARQFRALIAAKIGDKGSQDCRQVQLVVIPSWLPSWLHRPFARRALARFAPQIVHTHLNPAARRVGRVAQRLGIGHVMTLHLDYDPNEHAGYDGLIALAATQRKQIPDSFSGQVAIVWNWMSAAVGEALARVTPADIIDLRRTWGADDDAIVFGSVGRLKPEKGMDWLVRAFRAAFPTDDRSVRLVIVGSGAQRSELERLIAGDTRIVLAGQQAGIAHYYRAFDVFVSAARFEPFGLAIIEAMGAGCPLIATRIYGTLEFVTDRRTLWTDPDDEGKLVTQLRTAAARGRLRYDYDMTPFTLARAVREIDEFYRGVERRAGDPDT